MWYIIIIGLGRYIFCVLAINTTAMDGGSFIDRYRMACRINCAFNAVLNGHPSRLLSDSTDGTRPQLWSEASPWPFSHQISRVWLCFANRVLATIRVNSKFHNHRQSYTPFPVEQVARLLSSAKCSATTGVVGLACSVSSSGQQFLPAPCPVKVIASCGWSQCGPS